MKLKRFLFSCVTLCLLLCLLTVTAFAVDTEGLTVTATGSCGDDVTYTVYDNGLCVLSGTGATKNYNPTGNVYTPLRLYDITEIVIETGITSLGNNLFNSCGNVTSITIPAGVTSIGNHCFQSIGQMAELKLPATLETIGSYAFYGCWALEELDIPDSVVYIAPYAFKDCTSLTVIPGVESANIRWTLNKETGEFHFTGTGPMPNFSSSATWDFYKDYVQHIIIDEGITTIGNDCFSGCANAVSVKIPSTVTSIGRNAFTSSPLTEITLPEAVTSIGYHAFGYCQNLTSITIPENVTSIGSYAFQFCSGLTEIIIPANVTEVGSYAFNGCDNLVSVEWNGPVTMLDSYIFNGCSSLTDVNLNVDTITSLESRCFAACTSLETIDIPDSVTDIGNYAFNGCTALTSIDLPDSVTYIGEYAFSDCTALASVELSENLEKIDIYAFQNCTALTAVDFPENLTTISDYAFLNCSALTAVKLYDQVTNLGSYAFQNCTALKTADLGNGFQNLKIGTFYECGALESVTFGKSVRIISNFVFYKCNSLKEITIPNAACTLGNACLPDGITVYGYDGSPAQEYAVTYGLTYVSLGKSDINDFEAELSNTYYTYNGTAKTPTVTLGSLTEGEHFTVSYADNLNAGTATVTVTGIGNCTGTIVLTFTIDPIDLSKYGTISMTQGSFTYTGSEICPEHTVCRYTSGEYLPLVEDVDYTLTYTNNTNAGRASITATGIGNYTGSCYQTFMIYCKSLTELDISIAQKPYVYSYGSTIEPEILPAGLVNGTDYYLYCSNNQEVGTATVTVTGTGNYRDSVTLEFEIVPRDLNDCDLELSYKEYTYNGTARENYLKFMDQGDEYTCTYEDNIEAGTAKMICTGVGNFTGTRVFEYTIKPWDFESWNPSFGLDDSYHDYTGAPIEPKVTNSYNLVEGKDYTVSYSNNINAGTATVTVTGIGSCTGTHTLTFTISSVFLTESDVRLAQTEYAYTGSVIEPILDAPGLTEGVDYTVYHNNEVNPGAYWVRIDGIGNYKGNFILYYTIVSPATPEAPTVKISGVSSSGAIKLSWNAVEGATSYEIYRMINGGYDYYLTSVTGTSYIDTDVVPGESYSYYVRANALDYALSEASNTVTRTADCARPVITLSNVASSGKIKVSWKAVDGAVKYQVYRSASGKSGTWKLMKTTTGTSYTNTSAEAGSTYYYRVRAIAENTAANSAYSSAKYRTCDLARPVVKVSNVASSGKIKVTWDAVEGAVKYQVYRSTSKNGTYTLVKTTTGTSYTNTSVKAGTLYYYKVIAVAEKSAANSAYSSIVSRTCDLPRPDVSITRRNGKPRLTWDAVDGAVSYKIYRATSKNGTYSLIKTTTGTSYTNTGAKSGVTYYYKVVAVHSKSAANSAYSSVVSIKSK